MSGNSQPFPGLRYCIRCNIPETQEGVIFDEMGICQACQSSEHKMHIDWTERLEILKGIAEESKRNAGDNYDCILPASGGKDSTFQAHYLVKELGMKPLCVTFSHNWYSKTGWYNLQNMLEQFDLDHIMFTPNRKLVNRIAKRSLDVIGDACWHCHTGLPAFTLSIAVKYKIPFVVWGESISETSGRASYKNPIHNFDRDYFLKVSGKVPPEAMLCDYLSNKDLYPFQLPTLEEMNEVGVFGIHLGNYVFWDEERQTEFVREHYGWLETEMEGTYKGYKGVECIMTGVHDFTCYLKRAYGRGTFHSSMDIRNGLLTRDEGFDLVRKHDSMRPSALDYYLKATGMTEEEFYSTMKKNALPKVQAIDLPVTAPAHPNAEKTVPYFEQLIDELAGRKDPRS